MSGQLRELKTRIKSVENTKKITRAMEMVAAAKLRKFQTIMENGRAYTNEVEKQMKRLYQSQMEKARQENKKTLDFNHPFFEAREEKRIAMVIMTSDTGLCGSYNLDLTTMAKNFLEQNKEKWKQAPLLIGMGKSGIASLKSKGYKFHLEITDLRASRVEEIIQQYKNELEKLYSDGTVDAIYIAYSHFETLSKFTGVVEKLLPLDKPHEEESSEQLDLDYIFEPDPETIFSRLVPLFFESKTRMIFLEALVSEQIARMHAMHQATENAKEMIDTLVLLRNKARQAAITKEIIEIVSGSQAAKKG
jgi:F-type H+-transporting ATPase subunit gamma